MRIWYMLTGVLMSVVPVVGQDAITADGQDWCVEGKGYVARVGGDGSLTSVAVEGHEFFVQGHGFARGGYGYDTTLMQFASVQKVDERTVRAEDERARLTYEFGDVIRLKFENKTDKAMQYVVVFGPEVKALRDESGRYRKPAVEGGWRSSTWFSGPAKLTITGGTRQWGPWGEGYQVWTAGIGAKQTHEMTLEAGMATPEETAKAKEAAERVVLPPTDPQGPMWDLKRFGEAPKVEPAEGFESGDPRIKAVCFEGPEYEGRKTKVFAWVGVPEAARDGRAPRVPGMVLVHGGGGTAFDTWVKLWVDRGYAAISMDTCGAVPKGEYGSWDRNPEGGPAGWGGWGQVDDPREDQWTFHAVASALLAHSLLRSLPEVDPERIGVTGISWGGYLTSIIAGVDPRYKLAVPVYGCGFTLDHNFAASVMALGKERAERWMRWWDPSSYLADARMPIMWVTGTNDFAYTLPALQKSYRLAGTAAGTAEAVPSGVGLRTLAIRIRMPHGHGEAGEGPKEIRAFADSILKGADPLPKVTGQGREGQTVWATFESKRPLTKAELTYTKATGPWMDRLWEAAPATVQAGKVTATLPEGVAVYYLNLFVDCEGDECVVSTEHEEIKGD